jgi:hypothetical protein
MALKINPKFISSDMATDQELLALQNEIDTKQSSSEKNQPNGYAGLDNSGTIPMALLPADLTVGSSIGDIDGGSANSVYLTEDVDGGGA